MDLIVRGGTIVTATDTYKADIGVEGGKVAQIGGSFGAVDGARVIDASGRYVFPGGVDPHTHLDMAGQGTVTADDHLTGTIAAACGGTTTIVDFCGQVVGKTLAESIQGCQEKASAKAAVDYGFHSTIVHLSDEVLEEIPALIEMGVTSFKLFMAYKGGSMIDDWTLVRALEQAGRNGALVMVHAENGDAVELLRRRMVAAGKTSPKYHAISRPPRTEAEATARAMALAEVVGAPIYIAHLSCIEALEEVRRARDRGVGVQVETCPQYLYLTREDLDRPGFEGAKYVFTPPARTKRDQEALWGALAGGVIQLVSSDHCPYNYRGQKELGLGDFTKIPNGGPGIEERLMLVYQGVNENRITPNRFVDIVSTTPAKLFGLYPAKGTIAIGSDADLVVWDPEGELTIRQSALHHHVDYTLSEGRKVRGVPQTVILRGEVIVSGGSYVGRPGTGRFIRRQRYPWQPERLFADALH